MSAQLMSAATATQEIQLVIFRLDGTQYALPITHVQEIIRYTQPRPVASNDSSVHGVLNLRGRIVPVHDIATRLGVELKLDEQAKIVIIDNGTETAGVIVEAVDEVLTIADSQLQPPPSTTNTDLIEAIVNLEGRLVMLLAPSTIFDAHEDITKPGAMSTLDIKTASRMAAGAADMTDQLADGVEKLAHSLGAGQHELHDLASAARKLADQARRAAETVDQLAHTSQLADRPDGAEHAAERDLVLVLLQTLQVAFESSDKIYRQADQRLGDRAAVAQEHWLDPADPDCCES